MNVPETDYAAWLKDLVRTCLPLSIQKKVITLAPLTREEAGKFADVLLLAGQARQFIQGDRASQEIDGIGHKIDRLLAMSRKQLKNERAILWYTSSGDPKFSPDECRARNAVRHVMVQYAQTLIDKDITLSERSAAHIVIGKFKGIDGAYGPEELETFRRQINRKNPLG